MHGSIKDPMEVVKVAEWKPGVIIEPTSQGGERKEKETGQKWTFPMGKKAEKKFASQKRGKEP